MRFLLFLFIVGCVSQPRVVGNSPNKFIPIEEKVKKCVFQLIQLNVPPIQAMDVCDRVYQCQKNEK